MSNLQNTLTNTDAVDIIENEGIGYAVLHYCDADNFIDPKTQLLWKSAELALKDLQEHLENSPRGS